MAKSRAVALLCLGLATSAVGQLKPALQTGSLIPVKPEKVAENRAGPIRKAFARCIYQRDRKLSELYLQYSDPVSVDYAGAGISEKTLNKKFDMEFCLGREADAGALGLRMSAPVIRAMLAEESYLAANQVAPAPNGPSAPLVARRYASIGDDLPRARALAMLSDCIAREQPSGTDLLLRTVPGSVAEGRAARALGPAIGGCLTQGQTVKLTVPVIRGFVADGAWQLYTGHGAPKAAAAR